MLKKMDKTLLIASILLLIIGLVMVFSASNVTSFMKFKTTPYHFFNRQLVFMIVSVIISVIMIRIDSKVYGYFSWFIILGLIALLVAVLVSGVKVASIVWVSSICANKSKPTLKTYLFMFAILALIAGLILVQPDLGTTIIFLTIIFLMFMSLNISPKVKRTIVFTILAIGGIVILLLMNNGVQIFFERQLSRFDFKEPCSEEKFYTTGTQVCNGYIAFNNGGLTGLGLGNSTQKYLYLPEAYTDFIFAITVEELGLIISIIILILMFVVLWRIFIISKRANTDYGRLMCYGVFWYILLHIVVNLGGVMGIIPLTGVPLPFLSYGGSFLISLVISLTIVQRVAIESKIE